MRPQSRTAALRTRTLVWVPGFLGSSPFCAQTISLAWSYMTICPTFMAMPRRMLGARPLYRLAGPSSAAMRRSASMTLA